MKVVAKNKRAYLDYDIGDSYDAGIVLQGHEVKSIKTQHVNLTDASAGIVDSALRLYNLDVPLYAKTSPKLVSGYQPKAKRKLLVHQKELAKISAATDKKGQVVIPLEVYITGRGLIKVKLGVGKLRRKVEKKQILKERDIERQTRKELKEY